MIEFWYVNQNSTYRRVFILFPDITDHRSSVYCKMTIGSQYNNIPTEFIHFQIPRYLFYWNIFEFSMKLHIWKKTQKPGTNFSHIFNSVPHYYLIKARRLFSCITLSKSSQSNPFHEFRFAIFSFLYIHTLPVYI